MTAQQAAELTSKNVPFLNEILNEIKTRCENGLSAFETQRYRKKTIEALKELGYDAYEYTSLIGYKDTWLRIQWNEK